MSNFLIYHILRDLKNDTESVKIVFFSCAVFFLCFLKRSFIILAIILKLKKAGIKSIQMRRLKIKLLKYHSSEKSM